MRRRAPQGRRVGFVCLLVLQVALLACGDEPPAEETAATPSSEASENRAPRIERVTLEPASPVPGAAVRVVAEVEDPKGDPVKMSYEWTLEGRAVGNGTAKLMLNEASRGDELRVSVVASDGRADSEPETLSVQLANRAPEIRSLRIAPSTEVSAGEVIEAHAEAHDPEGDALEFVYSWQRNGDVVDAVQGPEFDTRELETGDVLRVEVRADDGEARSEPFASRDIRITNQPPEVTSRPEASSSERGFHYAVVARDPDGDAPLRFELEQAPSGMQIGARDGRIRWLPSADQAGRHEVRVVVDDLRGGRVSHSFEVEVGGVGATPAAEAP